MGIIFMGHTRDGCRLPEHSDAEWQKILVACAYRCFYCAEVLPLDRPEDWTKDHLVPLIRGGCTCCGNLVCSCRRCNSMKKEKTVAEFLQMKPSLVKTSGQFYTRIISLGPVLPAKNDPLLNAVKRLAEQKRFPGSARNEREKTSWAWRNPSEYPPPAPVVRTRSATHRTVSVSIATIGGRERD